MIYATLLGASQRQEALDAVLETHLDVLKALKQEADQHATDEKLVCCVLVLESWLG